jgi:Activator of Hsp90 ATPase homolog 1-like protein
MEMKNYIKTNYSVAIEVAKPPDDIFNHLINLKKWWPEDFDGNDIKLNSEFVFTTGDSHYSKNKVIEFIPNKKLTWLVLEGIRKTDNYNWTGTKMIFELTPKNDNTLVKFTYDGVVFEDEYERLVRICDMTLKEMFYNFIMNGKEK